MNSGKKERDAAHREATRLAAEERCLSCHADSPSEPSHWPTHRGMGSGKAGWKPTEWVPLCRWCHDTLDLRHGSNVQCFDEQDIVIFNIEQARARGIWPRR